jgi:hypothetical protein
MAAKLDIGKMSLEDLLVLAKDIEKAIKKSESINLKKARNAAEQDSMVFRCWRLLDRGRRT